MNKEVIDKINKNQFLSPKQKLSFSPISFSSNKEFDYWGPGAFLRVF